MLFFSYIFGYEFCNMCQMFILILLFCFPFLMCHDFFLVCMYYTPNIILNCICYFRFMKNIKFFNEIILVHAVSVVRKLKITVGHVFVKNLLNFGLSYVSEIIGNYVR